MVTGPTGRPTQRPRPWQPLWSTWLAPGTQGPPHPPHLSELLSERDGGDIGRTTLRRILTGAGLSGPRRRRSPKHRVHRQHRPREGLLVHVSPFTMLITVDDATGTVADALFCEKEDARSYFLLIQDLVWHLGLPVALYTDRHEVFRHTPGSGLPGMATPSSAGLWGNWGSR